MNACAFIKIVCVFKVFVFFYFFSVIVIRSKTFLNAGKLKRACIENLLHFVTLGSQIRRFYGDTRFMM